MDTEIVGTLSVDLPAEESPDLKEHARFLGIVASMIGNDVRARRSEALQRQTWEAENLRFARPWRNDSGRRTSSATPMKCGTCI